MSDKETSLEFVERMERLLPTDIPHHQLQAEQDARQLLKLAKTAALIDEHRLNLSNGQKFPDGRVSDYRVISHVANYAHHGELHQAVLAVADKIKEGK